jgi:hypothetical protein
MNILSTLLLLGVLSGCALKSARVPAPDVLPVLVKRCLPARELASPDEAGDHFPDAGKMEVCLKEESDFRFVEMKPLLINNANIRAQCTQSQ